MPLTRIPAIEATDEQLRDHLDVHGIEYDGRWRGLKLAAAVAQHQGVEPEQATILAALEQPTTTAPAPVQYVIMQPAEAPAPTGTSRTASLGTKDDPRFTIRISRGEGEGGDKPISVVHNGNSAVFQRGVRIEDVPARYVFALQDACGLRLEEMPKQNGVGIDYVDAPYDRFPVDIISAPSDEEIAAWREKTDHIVMA